MKPFPDPNIINSQASPLGLLTLHITQPDTEQAHAGAILVQKVSQLTGYPDPKAWPNNTLSEQVKQRQARAFLILTVTLTPTPTPSHTPLQVVAHSLLLPPGDEYWTEYPQTHAAYNNGTLAESGGTAVHPTMQKLGIANWMRQHRMEYAHEHNLQVVAVTWTGGPSEHMYRNKPEWQHLATRTAEIAQHSIDLWVETTTNPNTNTPL